MGSLCQNDIVPMSMRRNHVASTFIRRHFYVMCPLGKHAGVPIQLSQKLSMHKCLSKAGLTG